jgi:hypothetical protein
MAPNGSNEVKLYAVLTLETTHRTKFTQGASAVHRTALSAVDPTPLRTVGQLVTGAKHTLSHSSYPDADINFLSLKHGARSNANLLQ